MFIVEGRTERSAVLDDFLLLKIDRTERRTVLVACLLLKIDRAYGFDTDRHTERQLVGE